MSFNFRKKLKQTLLRRARKLPGQSNRNDIVFSINNKNYGREHNVVSFKSFLHVAVKSVLMKSVMRILIVANAITVIMESNFEIEKRGQRKLAFEFLHIFFTICFTFDFLMKILYHISLRGMKYLKPKKFLLQPNHIIEMLVLACSYKVFMHRKHAWRQKPTFIQVLPILRIVKLFRLSRELILWYRTIWPTVKKAFPAYMLFLSTLLVFGFAGFYLFGETVPELFGTPWDAVFRAFAISTKDSWPKTQMIIEERTGMLLTRWFCVLDIIFVGTIFFNLVVASVTDKIVAKHQSIGKKEEERRIAAIEDYRQRKASMHRRKVDITLLHQLEDMEEIPHDILDEVAHTKRDMFRNIHWLRSFDAALDMILTEHREFAAMSRSTIDRLEKFSEYDNNQNDNSPLYTT